MKTLNLGVNNLNLSRLRKLRETSKEERRGGRVNKKRRSEWVSGETERKCEKQSRKR